MKPILKYPGGKTSEIKNIKLYLPKQFDNYIEPFVGGGAVYFYLNHSRNYINDISEELVCLYKYIKTSNYDFFNELNIIIKNWTNLGEFSKNADLVNLYIAFRSDEKINLKNMLENIIIKENSIQNAPMFNLRNNIKFEQFLTTCLERKFKFIKKNEIKKNKLLDNIELLGNIESGIKSAYYTYLRDVYNKPQEYKLLSKPRKVAIYLFIREYCYSSMFRFNVKGEFNVPYGGMTYNKKNLLSKLQYYKSQGVLNLLRNTKIYNEDFYDFIKKIKIGKNDFMFLDPPYDTIFKEYDKNLFSRNDQVRLANYLINECKCKFMLIIKKTSFINELYKNEGLKIVEINKKYSVSFKNRNKKEVKHLIITNY